MQAGESEKSTIRTQLNLIQLSTSLSPNLQSCLNQKYMLGEPTAAALIMVHSLIGYHSNLSWNTTDDTLRDVSAPFTVSRTLVAQTFIFSSPLGE